MFSRSKYQIQFSVDLRLIEIPCISDQKRSISWIGCCRNWKDLKYSRRIQFISKVKISLLIYLTSSWWSALKWKSKTVLQIFSDHSCSFSGLTEDNSLMQTYSKLKQWDSFFWSFIFDQSSISPWLPCWPQFIYYNVYCLVKNNNKLNIEALTWWHLGAVADSIRLYQIHNAEERAGNGNEHCSQYQEQHAT